MKAGLNFFKDALFSKALDFRIKLFIVMAAAGTLVSLVMALGSAVVGNTDIHVLINAATALLSFSLLYYAYKTGNYQRSYFMSILFIFCLLFPALYFTAGGYHSGMPSFFIFAVMFTAFMLRGKQAFFVVLMELLVYTAVFFISHYYPSTVTPYEDNTAAFIAVWGSCMLICVILGFIMLLHFQAYENQQRELEHARQEAVKLSEIKSTFLANMSHEIRTPINVILGMNEMVLRDNDSDVIMGYARTIDSAGKSLLSLVNNILDVSKIESGNIELYEEEYSLSDLIRELTLIGRERAGRRSLSFDVRVDETLPSSLVGDYAHIKQVVVNFISNACKYTEKGGVTLGFRRQAAEHPGRMTLHISVADTGIGIEGDELATLFDAFKRADLPSHRDIQGTGLGLAIAKELADALGGSIHVESRVGVGSVFTLVIGQRVADTAPVSGWQQSAVQRESATESFIAPEARILVVDDNKANLQVVKSLLARTMMRIDSTTSSLECIEILKRHEYHLVLMDYRMPDMDGIETLEALLEIPGFDTPVVVLTAHALADSEQMFLAKGFAAYITKPIVWNALEQTIMRLLPPRLVIRSRADEAGRLLNESQRLRLQQMMLEYGVELEKGLRYLNGDILQYRKLVGFFLDDYTEALAETEKLFEETDWGRMQFVMHSLISKARMAGATELSDISACMEKHCIRGDGGFIRAAMPTLRLCWRRASDGLARFIVELEHISRSEPASRGAAMDPRLLMGNIRAYRRRESEQMLREAIDAGADELKGVLDAVAGLDFDEAETLFSKYMEGLQ